MSIPDVADEVIVRMPAWNALYQLRDFSSHVRQVEAFAGTKKTFIEKTDKQTWRIKGTGTIKITYATYWDEAGPFASQLNSEHAFVNPAMILMYVPERRSENVKLSFPSLPDNWINKLLDVIEADDRFEHIPVNREESAVGLCSGAYLSGTGAFALMGALKQFQGTQQQVLGVASHNLVCAHGDGNRPLGIVAIG